MRFWLVLFVLFVLQWLFPLPWLTSILGFIVQGIMYILGAFWLLALAYSVYSGSGNDYDPYRHRNDDSD